ncbi:MAG: tRNA pseudouridine(55) synthase TruB [bacterium]|nr:tRNA pseudouridine(55) synthase TruB [bacterium]
MLEPQLVVINKPVGLTSHDVVDIIRRELRPWCAKRPLVGHAGTLDPFATGVLIILIGQATKTQSFFMNGLKTYRATIALGQATDTGDLTGKTTATKKVSPLTIKQITACLTKLVGLQVQAVPLYAAAKVDGKKLYEYARADQEPPRRPIRVITIKEIRLIDYESGSHELTFETICTSGTYIRALAEKIATHLGTVGHLKALCRLQSGDFSLTDTLEIDV